MSETMPMSVPGEEILNPQTTLLLEDIHSHLPAEEVGVLTENGRINKQGREVANDVYQEFLLRGKGNFKQILELCREAESILDTDDRDSRNNETAKIIQSVRGKVVYNAHRTWVEKEMNFDAYGMGDLSASNVMKYAHILKMGKKVDVYEEATNIERERAEINKQLKLVNDELQRENDEVLKADIKSVTKDLPPQERESILKKIKNKLGNFTKKTLEPKTRRKIVAGTLSTLAVAGVVLGFVTNLRNDIPQVRQIEKIPEIQGVEIENDYLKKDSEIPETMLEPTTTYTKPLQAEAKQPEKVDETTKQEAKIDQDTQIEKLEITEQSAEVSVEKHQTNYNDQIIKTVLEQDNFKGILSYESNYTPENMVNLAKYDVVTLGSEVQIAKEALESVLGFIDEADSLGFTVGVAYGYRSYDTQEKMHADNPNGAAEAGQSQHQSGFAVDLYLLEYGSEDWGTMRNIPTNLIPIAQKWGLIRPLAWDTPHFVALNALSPKLLTMLQERGLKINPTDSSDWATNFALNEILMALDNASETIAMAP